MLADQFNLNLFHYLTHSGCTDTSAATCSTSNSSLTLTCAQYYSLVSGICQPTQFARIAGFGVAGYDIPGAIHYGVTSESACAAMCNAGNAVSGPYQTMQFGSTINGGQCACKYTAIASLAGFLVYPITNIAFVGSCAGYASGLSSFKYLCQDVTYPASGCIG